MRYLRMESVVRTFPRQHVNFQIPELLEAIEDIKAAINQPDIIVAQTRHQQTMRMAPILKKIRESLLQRQVRVWSSLILPLRIPHS